MRLHKIGLLVLASLLSSSTFAQTPEKKGTATVAGVVTLKGAPVRGVPISLRLQRPLTPTRPQPAEAKTDTNGRFRITGVAAGQYVISALAPGFVTEGTSSYSSPGKMLNISEGEAVENLELTLNPGGVITGHVTDAKGDPVVEINVRLIRVNEGGAAGSPVPVYGLVNRTDDRGVYRIFGLPAGKYKVSIGVSTRDNYFSPAMTGTFFPETFHPDTTDEAQAGIIELGDGQEATGVDIKTADAKRAYEIYGRVMDASSGKPVAGINLTIGTYGKDGRLNGGGTSTAWHSDANGEFQFTGMRPGRYAVLIENREGKSELYSEPTPVEVVDSDVMGVEVRAQPGAAVNGTVVIEGVKDPTVLAKRSQVRLFLSADPFTHFGMSRNAQINADGSFHFGGLPAGKFRFSSSSPQTGFTLLREERNGDPLPNSTIEIRAGDQLTGIRAVFGYGTAVVRGQVKIVGGALPEGVRLSVQLRSVGGPTISYYYNGAPVDERGRFLTSGLMPGDYELTISPLTFGPLPKEVMIQILPPLSKVRQTVSATNGTPVDVVITIDLGQEKN